MSRQPWIAAAEQRATMMQSFHVSQTPPGYITRWAGTESAAGVLVDEQSALSSTVVYACVRILAEAVASLPLILYRRLPGGGKERATDHPLYDLLHTAPNPEMTSFTWREVEQGHLGTWGNAYSQIVWSQAGRPLEFWPLRPDRMQVKRENGELVYYYRKSESATPEPLPANQVLHISGMGYDGVMGYSPIALARQAIGLGLATEEFGARLFLNGARPGAVLEHPGKLSDTGYDRLKGSWNESHQGLANAHKVAILEEGLKLHEVGIPPEDAQFLQTRKFQISEIARMYNVPLHMLAELERATNNNIEQQGLEFVTYTLMPWLVRWEQRISLQLLSPAERKAGYFAEYLVDGLLRGDFAARSAGYATGRQWGWFSANDVRRLENLNPIEGGDVYLSPMNMVPADQLGQTPAQPPAQPPARSLPTPEVRNQAAPELRSKKDAEKRQRLSRAQQKVLKGAFTRIVNRETRDILDQAKKRIDPQTLTAWLNEYYRELGRYMYDQLDPVFASYGMMLTNAIEDELGQNLDESRINGFIKSYVAALVSRYSLVHTTRITEVVAASTDPATDLETEFDHWRDVAPADEAREEGNRFGNAGAKALYMLAGVTSLVWMTSGSESCPFCQSLDGQVVGIEKVFVPVGDWQPEGAAEPMTVYRSVGHPPVHGGCDCVILAV